MRATDNISEFLTNMELMTRYVIVLYPKWMMRLQAYLSSTQCQYAQQGPELEIIPPRRGEYERQFGGDVGLGTWN